MPSFQGIQQDCEAIVEELKNKLRGQFQKNEASTKALAESIDLLLQLNEPADVLAKEFLAHAENQLQKELEMLKDMCENDVIEFVDMGSTGFLSDLCLIVASYNDMFVNRIQYDENEYSEDFVAKAISHLNNFIMNNMKKYFELINKRMEDVNDTAILVRALDRFHRRLQAMNTLCTESDFARLLFFILII